MRFSLIAALGAVGLVAATTNSTSSAHSSTKPASSSSTHSSSAVSTHSSSSIHSSASSSSSSHHSTSISVHSTKTSSHSAVSTTTHPAGPDHGKVICYGDFCIEVDCVGAACRRFQVVCCGDVCKLEVCVKCELNVLVICNGNGTDCHYSQCKGDECNRKIICIDGKCNREACKGDECKVNCVCTGADCIFKKCDGQCHKQINCTGDQCKPQPPPTGKPAPHPAPTTPAKPTNNGNKPTKPVAPTTTNKVVVAGADKAAIGSSAMLGAAIFVAAML